MAGRRNFLGAWGAAAAILSGCLAPAVGTGAVDASLDSVAVDDSAVSENGHWPTHRLRTEPHERGAEGEWERVPLDSLPASAREQFAVAATRGAYYFSDEGYAESYWSDRGLSRTVVPYGGALHEPGVGVSDYDLARYGDDWTEPVAVDATVEDGELRVAVTNDGDGPIELQWLGAPPFGVLFTYAAEAQFVVWDEAYRDGDVLASGDGRPYFVGGETGATEIAPDATVSETYAMGEGSPPEGTYRVYLPLRYVERGREDRRSYGAYFLSLRVE